MWIAHKLVAPIIALSKATTSKNTEIFEILVSLFFFIFLTKLSINFDEQNIENHSGSEFKNSLRNTKRDSIRKTKSVII